MGGTGWSYITEWREGESANDALQRLRKQVFAEKKFEMPRLPPGGLPAGLDEDMLAFLKERGVNIKPVVGEPKTIADLLFLAAEDGTHSILDITGVTEKPEFGGAHPAPDSWLMEAYGTSRPTRQDVETRRFRRAEEMERWQCLYFPVWAHANDVAPKWWMFIGSSGD